MDSYLLLLGATALGGIVAIYYGWRLATRAAAKPEPSAANPRPLP